ncbi:MAG: flagellar biosynthesis protein FliQ [Alphaproteobacteria bacterium]
MGATEVFDVLREGLWVALIVSLPVLGVALLVGVVIGLFQALTSIQEMTLTFVPKLAAILAVFWLSMGYSGQLLVNFYKDQVIENITRGY